jgi:uncharacterized protein involved in exopolysaccharide biosynthesis/Mrp family chromosome partitioning ATPase
MNERQTVASTPGLKLDDILYVIFRHKWMIAIICGAGVIGALALPFTVKPRYESDAKLLIKYVVEANSPPQVGASQSTVQQVEDSGANVLNTELEILTSSDLALQVADALGPQKVLGTGGGNDRYGAAGVIQNPKNLNAEVIKKSNVIRVVFQHSDPAVAQGVLKELIANYIKKHAEIHRGGGFDEFLTQETDQLHSRLLQTEDELRKAKSNLGIVSLDQDKKVCADQIAQIQQRIFDAEAGLAEREAAAKEIGNRQRIDSGLRTNLSIATNTVPTSPEKVAEYNRVCGILDSLGKREQELLGYLTPSNSLVVAVQEQISRNQKHKRQLEDEVPGLKTMRLSETRTGTAEAALGFRTDPILAVAEAAGLRSKLQVLTNRLAELQKRAETLEGAESSISELQRRRDLQEGYFTNFSQSLEQSRINERLGAGKVSNISVIQAPSAPWKVGSKLRKTMAMVLFGSVAGALGLAFAIEFFLDQSLKRPTDVEAKLGLPLFISIPRLKLNGEVPALRAGGRLPLLTERTEQHDPEQRKSPLANGKSQDSGVVEAKEATLHIAPWDPSHGFGPFSEALRDRLITFFEVKNLTHKPKLVAVTSCAEGTGVSTVAAGLAASLSETGEGNVLLVDMNSQNGVAHHFHRGDLAFGINDALEKEKRAGALVQDKLYMVTESTSGEKLPSALPYRFKHLVPRLKASDYDYIIFDMPPVSQVSLTPRLARFMDMVLMVVESGKTDREIAKKASSLLAASKANVGIVLNKTQAYVPKKLQQEL